MAKLFFVTVCVVLVGVFAEPPSSYLPPQSRNSLSGQYGAPPQQQQQGGHGGHGSFGGRSSGKSFSYNSLAENQFGGSSRSSRPRFGGSSQQQQAQNFDDSAVTNSASRFGASRGFASQSQQSGQYNAPAFRQQPASQYNAPSARQQPASQYNAPSARQQPASQYNSPSARQQPTSSYALPAARQQPSSQYGAPSSEYGAPLARKMDDDLAEPANYEYNYEVQAGEESGAEFGHQETREDDFAQGEYHVLLPDGRMQIVEYEADEEGFRPKIRYEETGYPDARDNQGPY